ncbi:hypothetical protein TTHERM_00823970 (macronuclear) [Tetrahymena thermophila SB210]|uniref:Uncharacterized protein n=1 Tax=Tetrahymena thermophila (strain SB210) TaxID=312017 RepID=I7LZG4_TETTS|nr:hypothetical protein TTHERM_00823970 [Tetrahymena thermophila SB210]EAR83834.1 hypothetical protein TTHERM_00823970 [Tetrahymena thermophila SB210]|eukprot:XP_001031497.1 hypothetical protein TTHERM_00823970 [Tetrahymena thermophila SB210]
MNKLQERQILIALLPKRFQFHSNDPILRKHPHLSGQNNLEEQQESFPQQIKKQQELKLKQLIMSKKLNKSKQNMLKQLGNEDQILLKNSPKSKRNKKEDFRMINLNQLDKHYRVRGSKIESKDKIGQNSFNLEQIQYETLGEEDEGIQQNCNKIANYKKINQKDFQNKLNQQQTEDQTIKDGEDITVQYQINNIKSQIQNSKDIRQRRNMMKLELNDKQSFEIKQNTSKSTAKSADYYQQIDLCFNNNSLNSSQHSPKIKKRLCDTKLRQENQYQNNYLDSLNHSQIQGMSTVFPENQKQQQSSTNREYKNYAKYLNYNLQRKAQQSTPQSTNQNSHRNSKEMINDLLSISSIYNQHQENKFSNSITPKSFYGFPVSFVPVGEQGNEHTNAKELDFFKSNKIDKSNTNQSCYATPCQEIGSPQFIFRKKKETMNKILGFLSKDKQPNIYEKMILKNKQIHLTGHHIETFSSAYKSHLGIITNAQQSVQQNFQDLYQQNKIETQKTERMDTEREREGQEFSNIKLKQWINQGQNTKDTAQFGKSEDIINYKEKSYDNFQESQMCAFYPYNQMEQNKLKKDELISVNKILIQPRANLRNAVIQRPLSTQTTFQPNCQSYLFNSSNPTSPSRYATPKDIQRKNLQTPSSQAGQQENQKSRSNIYQASRKSSINQNSNYIKQNSSKQNEQLKQEKKQPQNILNDNDKIERWIVNDIDIDETMSPLADKTNSFF